MTPTELAAAIPTAAFAFRGYNTTNLGRSKQLLEHPAFTEIVTRWLKRGAEIATRNLKRPVDLVTMIKEGQETTLATYGESIALVLAMESAQLELLEQHFHISHRPARVTFGYSLGEIAAVIASGVLSFEDALQIPLVAGRYLNAGDSARWRFRWCWPTIAPRWPRECNSESSLPAANRSP